MSFVIYIDDARDIEDGANCRICGARGKPLNDYNICSDCQKINKLVTDAAHAEELIPYEELEQASWTFQRKAKADNTKQEDNDDGPSDTGGPRDAATNQ